MDKNKVYTVLAHRWAEDFNHTYLIGVFSNKEAAIKAAEDESDYRGGKYGCRIYECEVNMSRCIIAVYESKSIVS